MPPRPTHTPPPRLSFWPQNSCRQREQSSLTPLRPSHSHSDSSTNTSVKSVARKSHWHSCIAYVVQFNPPLLQLWRRRLVGHRWAVFFFLVSWIPVLPPEFVKCDDMCRYRDPNCSKTADVYQACAEWAADARFTDEDVAQVMRAAPFWLGPRSSRRVQSSSSFRCRPSCRCFRR